MGSALLPGTRTPFLKSSVSTRASLGGLTSSGTLAEAAKAPSSVGPFSLAPVALLGFEGASFGRRHLNFSLAVIALSGLDWPSPRPATIDNGLSPLGLDGAALDERQPSFSAAVRAASDCAPLPFPHGGSGGGASGKAPFGPPPLSSN